jgi:hypothetical protein
MFKYAFKGIVQDKIGYQSDHLDFFNSRSCILGNFKEKSFFKLSNTGKKSDVCFDAELPNLKGIFQPFELGGVTRLIQSAVKFWKAGNLKKNFLMIQTHERSLKQISAA